MPLETPCRAPACPPRPACAAKAEPRRVLGLSPDLWRRSCITAWVIASLFCCARPLVQEHASTVYPIFARAARNWQAAADLYPMTAEPYRYSPGVAGLFTPFAVLPDAVGGCLWRVFSTLALLAAMTWFLRTCLPARWGPPLGALFFLIVLPSAVRKNITGQNNPLLPSLLPA